MSTNIKLLSREICKVTWIFLGFLLLFFNEMAMAEVSGGETAKPEGVENSATGRATKSRAEKNFDEWLELSQKAEKLLTKVKAKQQTIEDLIVEKNKEKDQAKQFNIIKDLGANHREFIHLVGEYEKMRNYLLYRFPERANMNKRTYRHLEAQTIEEIEKGLTVGSKVKKILHKISIQYEDQLKGSEPNKINLDGTRAPAGQSNVEGGLMPTSPPMETGITETVILKK